VKALRVLEDAQVVERVAGDDDEVGFLAGLDVPIRWSSRAARR
jgi:hypothetical protein